MQHQVRKQLLTRLGEDGCMAFATLLRDVSAHRADKPVYALVFIETQDLNLRWVLTRMLCAAMKRDSLVSYTLYNLKSVYDAGTTADPTAPVAAWRTVDGLRPSCSITYQTKITVETHKPLALCVTASYLADHSFAQSFWEQFVL